MSTRNQPLAPFDYPRPPTWAISKLIRQTIGNSRAKRRAMLHNLGYRDPGRAALRLDHLIRTGHCSKQLRNHLPAALGVPTTEVNRAFAETRDQRFQWETDCRRYAETKERAAFVPRLVLCHDISKRRVPAFILAFIGQQRLTWVRIPHNILTLELGDQLRELPKLLTRWAETEDGQHSAEWLGPPTGFLYKPNYDTCIKLDTDFQWQYITHGPVPEPKFSLRIKNQELGQILGFWPSDENTTSITVNFPRLGGHDRSG